MPYSTVKALPHPSQKLLSIAGIKSEKVIGCFFKKYQKDRYEIFLSTLSIQIK